MKQLVKLWELYTAWEERIILKGLAKDLDYYAKALTGQDYRLEDQL